MAAGRTTASDALMRLHMDLPFTKAQFFEVFAAYNVAVWPAQFVLTLLAVAMLVLVIRGPERAGRLVSYGLALLWAWMAIAYHLAFFWSINPAAPLFAAISLAAAAAFALGVTQDLGLVVAAAAGVYLLLRRALPANHSQQARRP